MMRKLVAAISVVLLVTGGLTIRHQAAERAQIREEIARLRREHAVVERLHGENVSLAAVPPHPIDAEELRRDRDELERLQPALAQLKQQLDWQLQTNAALGPPKPLAPGMTPIGQLTNAGAASPAAAAQSFFWTVAQADPDAMARQIEFTDDARARAQAFYAQLSDAARAQFGSPEKVMAIYLTSQYGRATGFEFVGASYSPQAADYGGWKVTLQTASGSLHDIALPVHRTADGWHEVIGASWVDEAARYLR